MLRRHRGGAHLKPFVPPLNARPSDEQGQHSYVYVCRHNDGENIRNDVSVSIKRLPFLSFLLMEPERREQQVRQPFKSPCGKEGRTEESNRLLLVKTLGMRRKWGSAPKHMIRHELPPIEVDDIDMTVDPDTTTEETSRFPSAVSDAPPPLVLWQSEINPAIKVVVPEIVGKFLRPHQREGVQFMFDCVCQVRGFDGQGCILADDMGLGKTLQSITLMYTLLSTGMNMQPTVNRAIVVCPTSLVKNWDDEITKWLQGRIKTIALCEAKRETVIKGINQFIEGTKKPSAGSSAQVLIISYETFRMHAKKLVDTPACCELLICDEAHRLKNPNSQVNKALSSLPCQRRVLLSGTPMQNDLEEFFAMVDFTNPNILGTPSEFRKRYLGPILVGREPDSTDRDREVAQSCSAMLCEIVNQFILRRGNILNAKHLPPKLMQVICCPLSPLQEQLYLHFLSSSAYRDMMKRQSASVLSAITALKKLCNHPLLVFDTMGKTITKLPGFDDCAQYFAAAKESRKCRDGDGLRGSGVLTCYPEWSGKMLLLDHLMMSMKKTTTDRIVIVSNYTQTLDMVSSLCQEQRLPFIRLDGTTTAKRRMHLVDSFNDPMTNSFAFLLSSKAGGCGLNLIGANRLVLFDPDWNPATDKQAAARVWREGQKKMCYVYRFLATGTLEEKIFQRQLSKEGLQNIVDDKEEINSLSSKNLKRLFVFRKDTISDTHDQLKCNRCQWRGGENPALAVTDGDNGSVSEQKAATSGEDTEAKGYHPQIGMPPEEDLNSWGHHRSYNSVNDDVMQAALQQAQNNLVSFAFSCRVDWELLEKNQAASKEIADQRNEERKRKRLRIIEAANKRRAQEKRLKPKKCNDIALDKSSTEYSSSSDEAESDDIISDESETADVDFTAERSTPETRHDQTTLPSLTENASDPLITPAEMTINASSKPERKVTFALENAWLPSNKTRLTDSESEDAFIDDVLRETPADPQAIGSAND